MTYPHIQLLITITMSLMQREEVIAKALREYRDKLSADLEASRSRQKQLVEMLAEHQLTIKTIASLSMTQTPTIDDRPAVAVENVTVVKEEPVAGVEADSRPAVSTIVNVERKGYSRDKLRALAYPRIQERFAETPFEVASVRELLDEMEPNVKHSYEVAWNLCNDLIREGKLKQAGIRRLPKGIVRLFTLKSSTANHRVDGVAKSVSGEG